MKADVKSISVLLSQEDYTLLKEAADSLNRPIGPVVREGIAFAVLAAKLDGFDKHGKIDYAKISSALNQQQKDSNDG